MPHIRANDPACAAWNEMLKEDFANKGFYHSIPLPGGKVLEGIISVESLEARLNLFPIPKDLHGKRVLDIGTWDGYFAFEMEKRGASVMAIDNTEVDNFYYAQQLLGSRADYRVMDVYELNPSTVGRFDYVLFMGVLYHLKHPLYALERVCEVTREMAIVETYVTNETLDDQPATLEFYERTELLGQFDNWCGPNLQCLFAFCRTAGFARIELLRLDGSRALLACYRKWEAPPANPEAEPPVLNAALHSLNYGVNFRSRKDEYVASFFKSNESSLTIHNVLPEVGGYGIVPVAVVHHGGDGWQANFKLPEGLEPGWHDVRIRTSRSAYSNTTPIAVDVPVHAENIRITGACDGRSWTKGEVSAGPDSFVSIWVAGLPDNADRGNVQVKLGGRKLVVHEVTAGQGPEPRQVNAKLVATIPPGEQQLLVRVGDIVAEPLPIKVT